jgi:hypothetical protein
VLTPWQAVLATAIAAFLGSLIAQVFQLARDRSERRERRLLDEQAHARENRYRFADSRRKLYGDLIMQVDLLSDHMAKMDFRRLHGRDYLDGQVEQREEFGRQLRSSVNQVTIVAPRNISEPSKSMFDDMSGAFNRMIDAGPSVTIHPTMTDVLNGVRRKIRLMVEEMRKDLAIDDSIELGSTEKAAAKND